MTATSAPAAAPEQTAPAPAPERGRGRWGLWAEPRFRRLWLGETTSGLGTAVGHVSLSLVAVVLLDASPLMMGVITAAAWLPWLLIGLPAGAWVDRWRRRRVMLVCDVVLALLFGSVPVAAWFGVLTVTQVVLVALLSGAAKVFFTTAYGALLPSVVEAPDLMEANGKLRGGESAVDVAGPGVAGLVAQAFGAATGLLLDSVSYLVSLFCLSRLEVREEPPAPAARRALGREIAEGVRFVVGDRYLRTLACFSMLANLALNGIQAVQTVFLVREVGLSPGAVGAVFAVVSVGGLAGAAVAARIARRLGTAHGLLACMLTVAPLIFLLPFSGRQLPVAVGALAWGAAVCGVVAGNVISGTFSQTYCPPALLGRVRASTSTIGYGAIPVGALLGGFLGDALGARPTIWIMSGVLLAAGLLLLASPVRTARDLPGPRRD
ncbi:MFS transporter [Kitasatospora sp. NPDC096128]|uniref:MFS transporter n=1 Tax=Kitasatospora sp. NPDC096128 TaxID=3155547 RepID=UPI00331D04A9